MADRGGSPDAIVSGRAYGWGMNTSSHIPATTRRHVGSMNLNQALSAALAIALIAATGVAWYMIMSLALASIR
jgi:hypothetical protein